MGFRDFLRINDLAEFLTAMKLRVLPFFVGDDDASFGPVSRNNPFPIEVVKDSSGSSGGGGGSDPDSAREATLGQVRDAVQPLAAQAGGEGLHVRPPLVVGCFTSVRTVTASAQNIPTNVLAAEATVHVVSGAVRRSIGGEPSAQTPLLSVGDSEEIRGAELLTYRVVREGDTDAQLCIEYRTLGQPTPPPPAEDV